jgi:hypothetical protein
MKENQILFDLCKLMNLCFYRSIEILSKEIDVVNLAPGHIPGMSYIIVKGKEIFSIWSFFLLSSYIAWG